jgi:hypothetical protein
MPRLFRAVLLVVVGALVTGCADRSTPTSPLSPTFDKRATRVTIDGVIDRKNEWRNAVSLPFMANAPEALVPAELLVQRDETNLYLAIRIARSAGGLDGEAGFEFDNDNDGVPLEDFDDQIITGGVPPATGLFDAHRFTFNNASQTVADDGAGGTNDGAAALRSDATSTTYEFRHPLNSGDSHDIALTKAFPQVGVEMDIRLLIPGGSLDFGGNTLTQVASFGGYCKLTAFPAVAIGGCASGQVASVRVTRNPSTTVVSLISMGTHQAFLQPLGLFTYDYLGNPVSANCQWQSSDPSIVFVDQNGFVSTGDATGSAVVSASCTTGPFLRAQGAVRITVS